MTIGASRAMDQKKKKGSIGFISRYLIEGLLALLPLAITIMFLVWITNFLVRQLGPRTTIGNFLRSIGLPITGDSVLAYFVGWTIVIVVIFLLGFIVDIGARKYIKITIDNVMQKKPLINKLYNVSVRIVEMVDQKEQQDLKGMQVVYCFFGGERGAAFLALMPTSKVFTVRDIKYHIVIIPSAPIPVGGSMMLVPEDSVEPTDMPFEDFTQLYLSMGASSPDILVESIK